jgi:hypothetical protein
MCLSGGGQEYGSGPDLIDEPAELEPRTPAQDHDHLLHPMPMKRQRGADLDLQLAHGDCPGTLSAVDDAMGMHARHYLDHRRLITFERSHGDLRVYRETGSAFDQANGRGVQQCERPAPAQ